VGAHPLFGALNHRGLNPIKLAHSPSRPELQPAPLTEWVSRPMPAVLVTGPTATQNSPFLPWPQPVLISPTHGRMARLSWPLSWPGWLGRNWRWYTRERSPISVLTRLNVEQLRWCDQRCYREAKPPRPVTPVFSIIYKNMSAQCRLIMRPSA